MHIESVLSQLQKRLGKSWEQACAEGSDLAEIVLPTAHKLSHKRAAICSPVRGPAARMRRPRCTADAAAPR